MSVNYRVDIFYHGGSQASPNAVNDNGGGGSGGSSLQQSYVYGQLGNGNLSKEQAQYFKTINESTFVSPLTDQPYDAISALDQDMRHSSNILMRMNNPLNSNGGLSLMALQYRGILESSLDKLDELTDSAIEKSGIIPGMNKDYADKALAEFGMRVYKPTMMGITTALAIGMTATSLGTMVKSNTQTIRGDFVSATNTQRSGTIATYAMGKASMVASLSMLGPVGMAAGIGVAGISLGMDAFKHSEKIRMYDAEQEIEARIYQTEANKLSTSARRFRS